MASDYGVPQLRPRAVFGFAIKNGKHRALSMATGPRALAPMTVGRTLHDLMAKAWLARR